MPQNPRINGNAVRFRNACDLICLSKAWKRPLPLGEDEETFLREISLRDTDVTLLNVIRQVVILSASKIEKLHSSSAECQRMSSTSVMRSRKDRKHGGLFRLKITVPLSMYHMCMLARSYMDCLIDSAPGLLKDLQDSDFVNAFRFGLTSVEEFVDSAKFVCAYPMAFCNSQKRVTPGWIEEDTPPRKGKFSPFFFGGVLERRLRRFFHSTGIKQQKLGMAILFAKRGCATVPESFVRNAFMKHAKAMDTEFRPPEPQVALLQRVSEIASEIWDNLLPSPDKCVDVIRQLHAPKGKASFTCNRNAGGHAYEFAMDLISLGLAKVTKETIKGDKVVQFVANLNEPMLVQDDVFGIHEVWGTSTTYESVLQKIENRQQIQPFESYGLPFTFPEGKIYHTNEKRERDDRPFTEESVWGFKSQLTNPLYDVNHPLSVRVAAVCEPLKVRIVTAGESVPYLMAGGMQQLMHDCIRKCPIFRLTGEPISSDIVGSIVRGPLWTSGDYSAATDGLNISVSKEVFESLLSKIPINDVEKDLFRSVIYLQRCFYQVHQADDSVLKFDVMQKNGQLMGSPLSFPILCIANLICFWVSLERYYKKKFVFAELISRVLINGDDIGFSSDRGLYEEWTRTLPAFGFNKSIGKNYVSPRFLTINSTCWDMLTEQPVQVKHLNCGFLTGVSRTSGREETRYTALSDYYNNLVDDCSPYQQIYRTQRFLHYNAQEVKSLTRDGLQNLYLPKILGGAGFRAPPAWKELKGKALYTDLQLAVASRLYEVAIEEHAPDVRFPGESPLDNLVMDLQRRFTIKEDEAEANVYIRGYVPKKAPDMFVKRDYEREVILKDVVSSRYVNDNFKRLVGEEYESLVEPAKALTIRPFGFDFGEQIPKSKVRCSWPTWARNRVNKGNWSRIGFDFNATFTRVDSFDDESVLLPKTFLHGNTVALCDASPDWDLPSQEDPILHW